MFKTVSRDQETTAALQAEFLNRLLGPEGQRPREDLSAVPELHPVGPLQTQSFASASAGPQIDITDFGAWLSAFEMDTLPDAALPSDVDSRDLTGIGPTPTAVSHGDNGDWDAVSLQPLRPGLGADICQIFLSWLNPDYSA